MGPKGPKDVRPLNGPWVSNSRPKRLTNAGAPVAFNREPSQLALQLDGLRRLTSW